MGTNNDGSRRLVRIKPKSMLGGICAGFGYYLGWPTWILRVIMVALVLFGGTGILAYLILWIFMPAVDELPPDYDERTY